MSDPLQELERLSTEARSKQGRMDAGSRKQAAALLQMLWTDPAQDPRATLPYLADLKAEALADAIAKIWTKMDGGRQSLFEQWLPHPATERDVRRLAFLVSSVVETDPSTAVRWLQRLAPPERKAPTKEARQHLAAGVLDTTLEFHRLALETSEPRETLRLYTLLWNIATDPAFQVPTMARVRLARAIVAFGKSSDGTSIGGALHHLQSQIRTESANWPTPLRKEFETPDQPIAGEVAPMPGAEHVPLCDASTTTVNRGVPAASVAVAVSPVPAASPIQGLAESARSQVPANAPGESRTEPIEPFRTPHQASQLEAGLAERIAQMPAELTLLRSIQTLLKRYAEERHAFQLREDELLETQGQISQLRLVLDSTARDRDLNREEVLRERARANDLADKLAQLAQNAEEERRRLGQQISVNASGRLEEYKNKLGSSLSRLVKDLPASHVDVSEELGRILLLQFHQFLDALRQAGIAVNAGDRLQ